MSGFKAKMHQICFPLPPQTPLGELTAPLRPLAVLNGPTSKAREGKGRGRGREGKVKEAEGETRSREGFGPPKILEWRPI